MSAVATLEVLRLVQEMRAKQREYYDRDRRTASSLHESKRLERLVDRRLEELLDERPRQPTLFGEASSA